MTDTPTTARASAALGELRHVRAPSLEALPPSASAAPAAAAASDKDHTINYLAYGSNLCADTFLGRRGITPLSSTPVHAPGLTLSFDLPGIAYIEPAFANVAVKQDAAAAAAAAAATATAGEASPLLEKQGANPPNPPYPDGVIGVVYEVTREDYARILATEGGGSSYQAVTVSCHPLSAGPAPGPAAPAISAKTLVAPPSNRKAQPSKRYLDLIRKGAGEHNLPKDYRDYLDGLQEYRVTSWRQWVGRAVWTLSWMPGLLAVIMLMRLTAGKDGRSPAWAARLQKTFWALMWGVYDAVFCRIFGNGERTVDAEGKASDGS